MNGLKLSEILLFITFLNKGKINQEIDLLISLFKLNDTIELRENIKEYITYFINVQHILNNTQ